MSASIKKFGPSDASDDIVAEIRENGVVVVEDVFPLDKLERLKTIAERELDIAFSFEQPLVKTLVATRHQDHTR